MHHLIDATLFVTFIAFVLWMCRPAATPAVDVAVWSDETERRLLAGSTRRDR